MNKNCDRIIRRRPLLCRSNPAKFFFYRTINKKRVGRSFYLRDILADKGGRLCARLVSPARMFNGGRKYSYTAPWFFRETELNYQRGNEFFRKEFTFKIEDPLSRYSI